MLNEIENGVVNELGKSLTNVGWIGARGKGESTTHPSIYVSVEVGKFSKQSQAVFRCDVTIFVLIELQNFSIEDKRREGIGQLLMGCLLVLANNDLGIKIQKLAPVSFQDITDEARAEEGLLLFEMQFSSAFEFRYVSREASAEYLKLGLKYYLQDPADDGAPDAEDITDIT